jgi:hypothetical protein
MREFVRRIRESVRRDTLAFLCLLCVPLFSYRAVLYTIQGVTFGRLGIPESAYSGPSILFGALQHPPFLLVLVGVSIPLLYGRKQMRWQRFEHHAALRWFVLVVAFPLVWRFATYQYNFYFDQPHHFDRLLLVVAYGLIWLHPAFVFAFVMALFAILSQFYHPIGFGLLDKLAAINLVVIFLVVLFLRLRATPLGQYTLRRLGIEWLTDADVRDHRIFVLVCAGQLGALYFLPGALKLSELWFLRGAPHYYLPIRWARGWLEPLSEGTVMQLYSTLDAIAPLLLLTTLAIQFGAIGLWWHRRSFTVLIAGFVTFHVFTLLTAGIAFWKWVVADLALFAYVSHVADADPGAIFTRRNAAIVTVIILLGLTPVVQAASLGWFTLNYERQYTYRVVSEDGSTVDVTKFETHPYDIVPGSVDGAVRTPLIDAGSTTDYRMARRIRSADSAGDIVKLEARYGSVRYDERFARRHDELVRRYVLHSIREDERFAWKRVGSPPHIWWTIGAERLPADETYTHVDVVMDEYLLTDEGVERIDSTVVRTIPVNATHADRTNATDRDRSITKRRSPRRGDHDTTEAGVTTAAFASASPWRAEA